jgi:hypothetical protein
MTGLTNALRLGQAAGARVRVSGPVSAHQQKKDKMVAVYLQLDGEPWKQDVPRGGKGHFVVRVYAAAVPL